MADPTSVADLMQMGLGGYQGWGNEAAIADWKATGGSGKRDVSASQAAGYNPTLSQQDIYEQQLKQRQAANAPAIASYQAALPEIAATYTGAEQRLAGEEQPLLDRYANLVKELKGREASETATAGKTAATEYGKRGIPLSSDIYQKYLNQQTGGISEYYGGQLKETQFAQEADVRDIRNQIATLADQRVAAERTVYDKIAELQAGGANQAITDSWTQYAYQQDQKFQSRLDDLTKQLTEAQTANQQAAAGPSYQTVSSGGNLYSFNPQTGQLQFLQSTGTGTGDETTALNKIFQTVGAVGNSSAPSSFQEEAGFSGYSGNPEDVIFGK